MLREYIIVGCVFLVRANHDLPEGSPCINYGVAGICRNVRYCPSTTLVDNKGYDKKYPTICSFSGKTPIVCCTDCEPADVTKAVVTLSGVVYKPGTNKSFDNCLEYISKLPYSCKVGVSVTLEKTLDERRQCHFISMYRQYLLIGDLAKRGEFPHMGLLGYGEDMESAQWLCGGSVISERFLLTAAHCSHHDVLGPVSFIALGILKRSDPAHLWQRYRVNQLISHPGYHPPSKYNDIALIQTDAEIKFSPNVLPICLIHKEMEAMNAQAEGWGAEGFRAQNSDGLRQAWLQKFSQEECDTIYPAHRLQKQGVNHTTQFCYGDHKENKDTCQGDSGGPLQIYGDETCVDYIIGVTSYGRACGFQGGAGIYTRVLPYLSWIEEHVWP